METLNERIVELKSAYLKTDYSFTDGSRTIVIRLDEENPELLSYLKDKGISNWAYLTACNPLSFPQTDEYNRAQQQLLVDRLKGFTLYKGEGKSREGNWSGEESFFVAGISGAEACDIGRDFGQVGILISKENLEPELKILYS